LVCAADGGDFFTCAMQYEAFDANEAEIARFRVLFAEQDSGSKGYLNTEEVTCLLLHLNFPLRTKEEQESTMKHLRAAVAVVEERGDTAGGQVNFWVVVQLLRTMDRINAKYAVGKVTRAATACRFQASEVKEFQEVFATWCEREGLRGSGDKARKTDDSAVLSKASLLRVLRGLGLNPDSRDRQALEAKLIQFCPEKRIDLANFLHMMRWMMDTNFCDLGKVVGK